MNGFPLVSRVMCVTFFHKKSQVSSFASPPEAKQPTSSSRNFVAQNRFFKEPNRRTCRNKHVEGDYFFRLLHTDCGLSISEVGG